MKDCCAPDGIETKRIERRTPNMDYIKSNTFARGVLCMAIMSLVVLALEASLSAETSLKSNRNLYVSGRKVKGNHTSDKSDHKVIVFYFHGNVRCFTCKRIEQLTKQAVKEGFDEEIKNGVLELNVINVEEPRNNHFIRDYQLYTRSVIVSDVMQDKEQRWKNLLRVWQLIHNEETFKKYIQKEVKGYLEGKQS